MAHTCTKPISNLTITDYGVCRSWKGTMVFGADVNTDWNSSDMFDRSTCMFPPQSISEATPGYTIKDIRSVCLDRPRMVPALVFVESYPRVIWVNHL